MRLLHTTTITLSSFDGDDSIPPYAILSHTWGDAEISFQDLLNNVESKLKPSEGYQKICSCCALAAREGHKYVWIDTCCIDKTSSAELSEAINSMYRWYKEAQVCYAYLADVCIDGPFCWSINGQRQFEESKWFTRGWTLQELLAPRNVVFHDKDWRDFGSRLSLSKQISLVTGIQRGHLSGMNRASAAQKMSWASGRRTRRVEDMAYSLMGIFDVNMPLLYGEGEKAFIRLQHEIIKTTDDESIFAWTDDELRLSGIFAQSPKAFARSGKVVGIIDGDPLYVRRTPYAVTNRGLAIEIFTDESVGGKAEVASTMTSFSISLLPLNCGRQSESAKVSVEQLAIEVKNVGRDAFVRSSPGQLRRLQYTMSVTSLVYICSVYKYTPFPWHHSFFINTSSLRKRGLSISDTYNCHLEQYQWDAHPYASFWRITPRSGQSIAAVLLEGNRDGNRQRFGIIFHAAEDTLGIDLMAPSTAESFQMEMTDNKYFPTNLFSRTLSKGPISLMLQDNRWVSIKLEGQTSTRFEKRYFVEFEQPCEEDRVYV